MHNIWLRIKESEVETGRAIWKGTEAQDFTDGLQYEDYGTQSRFKAQGANPDQMRIISLWGNTDPQVLIDALLVALHPSSKVVGAWDTFTGQRVSGIEYNAAVALQHMPDIPNRDIPPVFSPATIVTDVIIVFGQELRDF